MIFRDIRPFARFVRYLELNESAQYPLSCPLDARLFYVVEGEGCIELDGQALMLPVGSVLYINAGQPYRLCAARVVYLAVNFDFTDQHRTLDTPVPPVNVMRGDTPELVEHVTFEQLPQFNRFIQCFDCHALLPELKRLHKEYTRKLPFADQKASHLLASVLTSLARRTEQRGNKETRLDIEQVIAYIHAHLTEATDNRTIAKQFHFHPNYISAEFKRYTGQPLHQYVLETRVMAAVSLMESGNGNVADVAAKTGFGDPNYFSRIFKQVTGISPAKYIRTCVEKA